jgi:predicted TIM-barrel fold metal-dependent hydrolase
VRVPNSAGTAPPRTAAPALACDSHIHIYDDRFPMARPSARATAHASVAEYRLLQQRLGTSRVVVVQPAAYGTDNAVTVDAIRQLGPGSARGIAVLHPDASDAQLESLHAAGIRGLRFSQHDPATAVTTAAMIEPLAARVKALGWHLQLHLLGEQVVAMAEVLGRLDATLVFDHMGRLPQPDPTQHAALRVIKPLLDKGRAWVKLSGAYLDTRRGPPGYEDVTPLAREYAAHAPERMVWGSDWPHPTESDKPDDAALLDLLARWVPGEAARRRILVDNPAELYGF